MYLKSPEARFPTPVCLYLSWPESRHCFCRGRIITILVKIPPHWLCMYRMEFLISAYLLIGFLEYCFAAESMFGLKLLPHLVLRVLLRLLLLLVVLSFPELLLSLAQWAWPATTTTTTIQTIWTTQFYHRISNSSSKRRRALIRNVNLGQKRISLH